MTGHAAVVSIAVATAALCLQQTAPPVFRSGADAVIIDAAVFDSYRVVNNLKVGDFEVRDNGVVQDLSAADFNTLPIDLRLVFDTSGSISDDQLKAYLKTMVEVTGSLQPSDRCDIVSQRCRSPGTGLWAIQCCAATADRSISRSPSSPVLTDARLQ